MANSPGDGNHTTQHQEFFCNSGLSSTQRIIISALGVPLSIIAFLGNFLIISVLCKVSSLHPPSKLLLGCLACTDLGVGLIVHPLRSGFYLLLENSKGCYYFFIVYNFTGFIFAGVSLSTTTAISVDRLLALLLGLRYKQVVTVRRVRTLIAILLFSCTSASVVAFNSLSIAFRFVCALLLLCVAISSFCYTKIYRTLRLSHAQGQHKDEQGQQNGERVQLNKARYQKTVFTALWIQMALLACYLPYGLVTAFITITGLNTQSITFVWCLTASLVLSNSTMNPFLYYWKMREMRQAVKDTIRKFCCLLCRTKQTWSITSRRDVKHTGSFVGFSDNQVVLVRTSHFRRLSSLIKSGTHHE